MKYDADLKYFDEVKENARMDRRMYFLTILHLPTHLRTEVSSFLSSHIIMFMYVQDGMYNVEYDNGEKEYKVIINRIKLISRDETKQSKSLSSETVTREPNRHFHGNSSMNENSGSLVKKNDIASTEIRRSEPSIKESKESKGKSFYLF